MTVNMTVELLTKFPANDLPGLTLQPESDYFSTDVATNGYRWWYLDVVSDDGDYSLVIIGFVGSVFSPYYAAARRRGPTDPFNHCALNAILYGPGKRKKWALTERGRQQFASHDHGVHIGASSMQWQDGRLVVEIDERCNPLPFQFRGVVELTPGARNDRAFELHSNGKHHWWPASPRARATVSLQSPNVQFSGSAYLDSNFGSEPLEQGFSNWDWSRSETPVADGSTPMLSYRCTQTDGQSPSLSLALGSDDQLYAAALGRQQVLPHSGWRVARFANSDSTIEQVKTIEDTPFYARSLLTDANGHQSMHESLSLERFSSRWVQTLLPFRMPRYTRVRAD